MENETKEETKNLGKSKSSKQSGKDDLKEFFKQEHTTEQKPTVKSKNLDEVEAEIKKADHETLNKVLTDTLAPHLSFNESQKRDLKVALVQFIKKMLWYQLMFVAIPITLIFLGLCVNCPLLREIPIEIVPALFSFLKYYITAIIAELLAMLFFIVKFVFDKSIVDLVREMVKK